VNGRRHYRGPGDGSPPAGSRGRAPGGGLGASPPKGQRFLQILVKFEAYSIGNLWVGGVQEWLILLCRSRQVCS